MMNDINSRTVVLAGNPNVGKSSIFNRLTGLKQHTGNWAGKTVSNAVGYKRSKIYTYKFIDIPGTYSLTPHSEEEKVASDYIYSKQYDAIIVVCDATNVERNLILLLQILEVTKNVILCINLIDEADKKHIKIDIGKLREILNIPIVTTSVRKKADMKKLIGTIDLFFYNSFNPISHSKEIISAPKKENFTYNIVKRAEEIAKSAVTISKNHDLMDRKLDKIFTSKLTGYPIMILMLLVIYWLTISGANYPCELLGKLFFKCENLLRAFLQDISINKNIISLLIDGVFHTTARVISVMLPPMAIFFPLFTLIEDSGLLPRIAFNLDKPFNKCSACGKQALTMCMGFGCNAAGVSGCRIIDSDREKKLAILTNSFVPCNGRFPTIISMISLFFVGSLTYLSSILSALILTAVILLGILATFFTTKILSNTILKGKQSSYILELPPYRRPQILEVIIRSVLDRTLFTLGRAAIVAIPAGAVIWLLANINAGDIPLIVYLANLLEPIGSFLGLDGVILLAFILGFPANEIVLPICAMIYTWGTSMNETLSVAQMGNIFISNGWTFKTAICVILFSLFHWPCSTTLLTVKKETGSGKWSFLAFIIPTILGIAVCSTVNIIFGIFRI